MAVVAGGTVAACTTAAVSPAISPKPAPAVTGAAAPPASGNAVASYAATVRVVLPSVVLIRTADGLGSGVVLDRAGNIVTNAHVAGRGVLQVQRAGDPALARRTWWAPTPRATWR
jgi:S1-C subfamily serine protease